MSSKIIKSSCFEAGCHARCGVLLEVEDGKIISIKGNKEHPFSQGFMCPKGRAFREVVDHPERITQPLMRVGEKGSGRFEPVSWDMALDTIAENLKANKEKHGAESLVFGAGTVRGNHPHINRFLADYGSPNFMSPINMSGGPVIMGSAIISGLGILGPDYANTKCVTLWGHNPEQSFPGLLLSGINKALKGGAKLIVVDPRGIRMAHKADHWLQLRPGTDAALALGMINVIIENGLYDKDFVEKWTVGFNRLKEHVKAFPLEKCSEITGVPAEDIKAAAVTFANAESAAMGPGMASMCQQSNAFQIGRALTCLIAITGNLDVPGGTPNWQAPTGDYQHFGPHHDVCLNLPQEQADKQLPRVTNFPLWGIIPLTIPCETVWPAMLEGDPYWVKACGLFANNAMCAYGNSEMVKAALSKLDFLFCIDFFHNPTTLLADVILPPAHWTERDDIEDTIMMNHVFACPKAVEPRGECWNEKDIFSELAKRMGFENYWKDAVDSLDYRLKPIDLTYEKLKEMNWHSIPVEYKTYEKAGFATESTKVELYSELCENMGYSGLPFFEESFESPVSTPELAKEYPLILTTGGRDVAYFHSSLRNIPSLRKLTPDPELHINPETARSLNIEDGEWVHVVTRRGRIEQKTSYFEHIKPEVVHIPHGFWYGKDDSKADIEEGWNKINVNQLTDNENLCPATASVPTKAMLCRVEKIPN
jgi:anaerobic selenocysteine-containing dehydrogenase